MLPTRAQVKAQWRGIFDDDAGKVFTDAVFNTAFQQAFDALYQGMLIGQCPAIDNIAKATLNANATSLTPAAAGISDLADLTQIRERLLGSSELYRQLCPVEQLTQRAPSDRLIEFDWRNSTFYFIGATTPRDLEITYESSGTAPTDDGTAIGVDGALSFLANYCAGVSGARKGYNEDAGRCMLFAVGPKYDVGVIGGELFRLVQHRVRSEQKTPIAPRPFSAFRRGIRRVVPYVAAQQPQGVATAPAQFSTNAGTITGTLDGANATFFLAYPVAVARIYRNGVRLTEVVDYAFGANQIVFTAGQIPQPGDIISADGWA